MTDLPVDPGMLRFYDELMKLAPPESVNWPLPEQRKIGLITSGEIRLDQIVLTLEMIVQRSLGDARLLGDGVYADAANAVIIEQRARR